MTYEIKYREPDGGEYYITHTSNGWKSMRDALDFAELKKIELGKPKAVAIRIEYRINGSVVTSPIENGVPLLDDFKVVGKGSAFGEERDARRKERLSSGEQFKTQNY